MNRAPVTTTQRVAIALSACALLVALVALVAPSDDSSSTTKRAPNREQIAAARVCHQQMRSVVVLVTGREPTQLDWSPVEPPRDYGAGEVTVCVVADLDASVIYSADVRRAADGDWRLVPASVESQSVDEALS